MYSWKQWNQCVISEQTNSTMTGIDDAGVTIIDRGVNDGKWHEQNY